MKISCLFNTCHSEERSDEESAFTRALERLLQGASIFIASLREIFDESAYARFLRRTHSVPSCQAYAAFQGELDAVRHRRPKCC